METKTAYQPLLPEFMQLIEQIPSDLVAALHKAAVDENEKHIINAFSPTLINQFKEVALLIGEFSGKAAPSQKKGSRLES